MTVAPAIGSDVVTSSSGCILVSVVILAPSGSHSLELTLCLFKVITAFHPWIRRRKNGTYILQIPTNERIGQHKAYVCTVPPMHPAIVRRRFIVGGIRPVCAGVFGAAKLLVIGVIGHNRVHIRSYMPRHLVIHFSSKARVSLSKRTAIIGALHTVGFLLGLGQGGEKHTGKYADDRNDHEKLD